MSSAAHQDPQMTCTFRPDGPIITWHNPPPPGTEFAPDQLYYLAVAIHQMLELATDKPVNLGPAPRSRS